VLKIGLDLTISYTILQDNTLFIINKFMCSVWFRIHYIIKCDFKTIRPGSPRYISRQTSSNWPTDSPNGLFNQESTCPRQYMWRAYRYIILKLCYFLDSYKYHSSFFICSMCIYLLTSYRFSEPHGRLPFTLWARYFMLIA